VKGPRTVAVTLSLVMMRELLCVATVMSARSYGSTRSGSERPEARNQAANAPVRTAYTDISAA
jgi:hypothetical protein